MRLHLFAFFFQAEDGIRDGRVTGVQTVSSDLAVPAASKSPGRSPVTDVERPGLVGVPPAIQQHAARQVIARCQELGNPSRSEERRVGKVCSSLWEPRLLKHE